MKIVIFGAVFSLIFSLSAQAYERIAVADRIKLDEAKEVIPKLVNDKQACIVSKDFKFPIKYTTHNRAFTLGRYLKTFKKIGLITSEKKNIEIIQNLGFAQQKMKVMGDVYNLTDLGKKYFKQDAEQWLTRPNKPLQGPGFCYGEIEVMTVHRMRSVNSIEYYLKVNNKPEWAMTKAMENTGLLIDYMPMKITFKGIPDGKQASVEIRKKSGEWKLHFYR
jgi:hypothetical protein